MADLSTNIQIITLSINSLNTPNGRLDFKTTIFLKTTTYLKFSDTGRLKVKSKR